MHQKLIKSTCSWITATSFKLKKKKLINARCVSCFSQLSFIRDNVSAWQFLMHIFATFHKTTCSKILRQRICQVLFELCRRQCGMEAWSFIVWSLFLFDKGVVISVYMHRFKELRDNHKNCILIPKIPKIPFP